MQYAMLIYVNPEATAALAPEQQAALSQEYLDLRKVPGVVGGAGLKPVETATTLRVRNGDTLLTDGPYADTKEVFGGYYLFEAETIDAALELAERIPAVRHGGAVEVRPVM